MFKILIMKNVISTFCFIAFCFLIIGCTTKRKEPIPGGPCEYKCDTGYVKIVAFGDTIDHRIEAVFNFYDNDNRHLDILEDVLMDSACINRNGIAISDSFYCIRGVILKGTCVPKFFDMDTASCYNN